MWWPRPRTSKKTAGHSAGDGHTGPSWADRQWAGAPAGTAGTGSPTRREPRNLWVIWAVFGIALLAGLLPIVLFPSLPLLGFLLWTAAVALATGLVVRRLLPGGAATAPAAPPSRLEKLLNWLGVLIALLTLYEILVSRRPVPLWLWVCCMALVAVVTAVTLRTVQPDHRQRVITTVYGMVISLCVLFPLATLPPGSRLTVSALLTVVMLAMVVLLIGAAKRLQRRPVAEEPQGKR